MGLAWIEIGALQPQHLNIWDDEHIEQLGLMRARASVARARIHSEPERPLSCGTGNKDSHLLAGSGNIDFPRVLKALRDAGYEGVWMSEGGDAVSLAETSQNAREFVRRMRALEAARTSASSVEPTGS